MCDVKMRFARAKKGNDIFVSGLCRSFGHSINIIKPRLKKRRILTKFKFVVEILGDIDQEVVTILIKHSDASAAKYIRKIDLKRGCIRTVRIESWKELERLTV